MEREPDFYLTSAGEGDAVAAPRACWFQARLTDIIRAEHMLVLVSPSVIGQRYGLGSRDINHLLLSPKYEGSSLFPVAKWPCHVYVSRLLNESVVADAFITERDEEIIAWGIIFRTLGEAKAHAERFQPCRS